MFHSKDIATNAINSYNRLLYTETDTRDLIESTRTWSRPQVHVISLKTHGWSLADTSLRVLGQIQIYL